MNDKNYITPSGYKTLQGELKQLRSVERPQLTETIAWAAGNGDRSENGDYIYGKKRLREIDRRIRYLLKKIENAEVIDPASCRYDDVRFGAKVTVLDMEDQEKTYTIVGEDETDIAKGFISWKSPVAKALLRKKAGDVVEVRTPNGIRELEIVEVCYGKLVDPK